MEKVRKLSNRIVIFLIFLLSMARVAVARIWPFHPPAGKAAAPKVFALTEADWLALRAIGDKGSKSTPNAQQQSPEDKKATAPNPENKDKAKSGEEKQAEEKKLDDKKAEDKKSESAKDDCIPFNADDEKGAAPAKDAKNAKDAKDVKDAKDAKDAKKNTKKPCEPGKGGGDGDLGGTGG